MPEGTRVPDVPEGVIVPDGTAVPDFEGASSATAIPPNPINATAASATMRSVFFILLDRIGNHDGRPICVSCADERGRPAIHARQDIHSSPAPTGTIEYLSNPGDANPSSPVAQQRQNRAESYTLSSRASNGIPIELRIVLQLDVSPLV